MVLFIPDTDRVSVILAGYPVCLPILSQLLVCDSLYLTQAHSMLEGDELHGAFQHVTYSAS